MDQDVFEAKWRELRGQMKQWWSRIAEYELTMAAGRADQLIRLLQEKYGYTRGEAEQEFYQRIHAAVL